MFLVYFISFTTKDLTIIDPKKNKNKTKQKIQLQSKILLFRHEVHSLYLSCSFPFKELENKAMLE
jgi:hypothetical protein